MESFNNYTDLQLLKLSQEGNDLAFLEFFNRRADGIYAVVIKIVKDAEVAKDIVQDAFIIINAKGEAVAADLHGRELQKKLAELFGDAGKKIRSQAE